MSVHSYKYRLLIQLIKPRTINLPVVNKYRRVNNRIMPRERIVDLAPAVIGNSGGDPDMEMCVGTINVLSVPLAKQRKPFTS